MLIDQIQELRIQFQEELKRVKVSKDIEELKVKFLGRKGPVQELVRLLGTAPEQERKELGKNINLLKEELSNLCEEAFHVLSAAESLQQLREEKIDITLPGRRRSIGGLHPITQMMQEVAEILVGMGFSIQTGPDIDNDYYNYEGLNFPPDHPAREMQDTFYVTPHWLLRSHTSNVQLRVMEKRIPPIRMIAPGTVYRNETISSRSHVYFHQVEGMYIDQGVSFADPSTRTISYYYTGKESSLPLSWQKRELAACHPFSYDDIFPLVRAEFDGLSLWAPHKIVNYLQGLYGENLDPVMVWNEERQQYLKVEEHPYWLTQ